MDLSDIKGHHAARRLLEIAAVGGHDLVFVETKPDSGAAELSAAIFGLCAVPEEAPGSMIVGRYSYGRFRRLFNAAHLLVVEVDRPTHVELQEPAAESSSVVARRVAAARRREPISHMDFSLSAGVLLAEACRRLELSASAETAVLKVAATIARMDAHPIRIETHHVAEALQSSAADFLRRIEQEGQVQDVV